MADILTGLTTAVTAAAGNITSAIGDILPIALPVAAAIIAVRVGWKFFKGVAK